jgi:phosphoglycolate phosphatase-like HAD superfamily hydrolase
MAAGIRVVGVTYGFRAREALEGADFIIERFDELMKVMPLLDEGN